MNNGSLKEIVPVCQKFWFSEVKCLEKPQWQIDKGGPPSSCEESDARLSIENVIKQSNRTGHLLVNERRKPLTRIMENDFFGSRVVNYWNKLPCSVKNSTSINDFKNNLGEFRKRNFKKKPFGQFWELSEDIYQRIY